MSVRSYVALEKFLVFVFLSDYMRCDSVRRNYPICLKFEFYVLCKTNCTVFDAHCPNNTYTEIHKIIPIHYGLQREKSC